jgi:hypothetical protein
MISKTAFGRICSKSRCGPFLVISFYLKIVNYGRIERDIFKEWSYCGFTVIMEILISNAIRKGVESLDQLILPARLIFVYI